MRFIRAIMHAGIVFSIKNTKILLDFVFGRFIIVVQLSLMALLVYLL